MREREKKKLREMLFLSDLRTNFASDIDLFFKDLLKITTTTTTHLREKNKVGEEEEKKKTRGEGGGGE